MRQTNFEELLEAGAHFGHMKRKWNPAMAPYIFMERNGIHIMDLHKTVAKIEEAAKAIRQIAMSDKKILFVATKKQAKQIVADRAAEAGMPYITERWAGGMLTNFQTIRKAVKKMDAIDKMSTDGTLDTMSKRERLQISRQREKLELNLGSISDMTRIPAAIFVVDVMKEHIAVSEARYACVWYRRHQLRPDQHRLRNPLQRRCYQSNRHNTVCNGRCYQRGTSRDEDEQSRRGYARYYRGKRRKTCQSKTYASRDRRQQRSKK